VERMQTNTVFYVFYFYLHKLYCKLGSFKYVSIDIPFQKIIFFWWWFDGDNFPSLPYFRACLHFRILNIYANIDNYVTKHYTS